MMNQEFAGFPEAERQIVYVRSVTVSDLPEEMRDQIGDIETVYSVHRPNGERLALVLNRDLAFSLARQNDFAPVSVH